MNWNLLSQRAMILLLVLQEQLKSVKAQLLEEEKPRQDREYWYTKNREEVKKRLKDSHQGPQKPAKNVVLFVGDGMGISTITAARILRGQRAGEEGEETELAWDKFPAVGLAKTYNANAQVGESSACATALLCGVKANFETVGVDATATFQNCHSSLYSRVSSIIDWAQEQGKATGIVTNTRITHATPAALYAHSPSRFWEDDAKVPVDMRRTCKDITRQLLENDPGRSIEVLLGGGRRHWLPNGTPDPEDSHEEGRRLDGRNLIKEWLIERKKSGAKAEYVINREELQKVDTNSVDNLLGLFAYSHMDFDHERNKSGFTDPSLAEMTHTAIKILQKNEFGFFLFIEGGRIDHGHHYNNGFRALDETLAFEAAVVEALSLINTEDTLILVTSDHSHVMTFGGVEVPKGNPILGLDSKVSDIDGMPYSTILYGNGPGYTEPTRRIPRNFSIDQLDLNAVQSSAAPRSWATHSGEDVPVYAQGPYATALFTGTFDQSYIPHAIAYSACLSVFSRRCDGEKNNFTYTAVEFCPLDKLNKIPSSDATDVVASSVLADDRKTNSGNDKSKRCDVIVSISVIILLVLFPLF